MSYQLLSKTTAKARKEHACIWCPEIIELGDVYLRLAGTFNGGFQNDHYHPECFEASQKHFREDMNSDGEFEPNTHKRGSLEER